MLDHVYWPRWINGLTSSSHAEGAADGTLGIGEELGIGNSDSRDQVTEDVEKAEGVLARLAEGLCSMPLPPADCPICGAQRAATAALGLPCRQSFRGGAVFYFLLGGVVALDALRLRPVFSPRLREDAKARMSARAI